MNDDIRVGLIRCDTHGAYYGALMDRHDPVLLAYPLPQGRLAKYSWQTGGAHYYFYTRHADRTAMTVPAVEGFRITRVWDEDRWVAENFSAVFDSKPRVCDTFAEISDDVDLVFIADCNGDGSDHRELATPGIEKGVPTFIDKPFAFDVGDARALVELAERRDTLIMSASILGELPHAARFRDRFAELEKPAFGTVRGGSLHMAALIHAISLALHLFGDGVESVEAMGQAPQVFVHLGYGGRPDRPSCGGMLHCDAGPTYHCSFYASAYSRWGAIHSPNLGDFEFPYGAARILEQVREMVRTRRPPKSYAQMIEPVAIATAIRLSLKEGRKVGLADL
ncbi:MAG TPA: Gfo/Idh/MocA family oxidoreductase [Armatimonadota bacterium]|nr:Gfo/Idh/MocA family oxidoreductase [Armatimonadota bacterium]